MWKLFVSKVKNSVVLICLGFKSFSVTGFGFLMSNLPLYFAIFLTCLQLLFRFLQSPFCLYSCSGVDLALPIGVLLWRVLVVYFCGVVILMLLSKLISTTEVRLFFLCKSLFLRADLFPFLLVSEFRFSLLLASALGRVTLAT